MATSAGFSRTLKRFMNKDVIEHTEKQYKRIADDLGRSIIRGTPVASGRAKNNWYFTKTRPSGGYNPAAKGVRGSASFSRLRGAVGTLTLKQGFYISNNTPYIGKLERGSSKQAPVGFLRLNIARVTAKYKIL